MARSRPEYKIHPLDLKKNTAIGVMLPMGGTPIFKSSYTTEEQAVSNLKNLLLTRKGERPFQPLFGTDVYSLLFEQMSDNLQSTLESTLRTDIGFWLPYIIIDEIVIDVQEDYNTISLSMKFKITETGANQNITLLVTNQGGVSIV
jgi:phage baseplate assembly protein W